MNSIWSQQFQALSALLVQFIPVECRPGEASSRKLEGRVKAFLAWWLLSWDWECSLCLAGIEEIRDQWEVLQCSLMGDTGVLHLKPGGGKKKNSSQLRFCTGNMVTVQDVNFAVCTKCKNISAVLTSLLRIRHSIQGVGVSRRRCRVADPDCRPQHDWTWASLRYWAQVTNSAPRPGPGRPQRDPTGCCWTLGHPRTCSGNKERSKETTCWTKQTLMYRWWLLF